MTAPGTRRAVPRRSLWAVAVLLGVYAAGAFLLWARVPILLKWTAFAVLLVDAFAILLLWGGVVRWSLFLKWAAVTVALGVYAAEIYLLWIHEPIFLSWTAFAVLLVDAVGILLLWDVVRWSLFLKWAPVAVALGVCAVGILLLLGAWDGSPVAAAFTRVGGATRVETALEASRFWLTPPQLVVEAPADASQQIMLGAAQCAMAHDAPLLFTSPDPRRQQLVDATISDWRKVEPTRPELVTIESQRDVWRAIESTLPELTTFQNLPEVITIQSPTEVKNCLANGDPADVAGLSTLEVPNPLIRLPQVPVRQTLASVVVFAAAIEPGDPPDVAVGLALAAHLARAKREDVSLVVVPHYLESDPELEDKLQGQHELVTGGIVLGETPTVPEDTRVLLRQLLISRDRQGVLAQVQANLGSAGSLIAALVALVGLGTATRIAGPKVIERLERAEQERAETWPKPEPPQPEPQPEPPKPEPPQPEPPKPEPPKPEPPQPKPPQPEPRILVFIISNLRKIGVPMRQKESDWLIALGKNRKVTIRLRSGRQVAGIIEGQFPANTRDATVFRIKDAYLVINGPESSQSASTPRPVGKTMLVSVKEIELIDINDSESDAAKVGQTSAGGAETQAGGQGQD